MKIQKALLWLLPVVGMAALLSSGMGLFWNQNGTERSFTAVHGETVTLYGKGLYQNDSLMAGAGFQGTDAVILLVVLPLLIYGGAQYRRGSVRGAFILTSALSFLLYNALSVGFGVMYNFLFPVYILYTSASFFAFVLALTSFDLPVLPAQFSERLPVRGISIFLFFSGTVLFVVWGIDLVGAILTGGVPATLGHYTSMPTYVLDMGVITPTAILAAVLLQRRAPLGYLLAGPMLLLNTIVGIMVISQTVAQTTAGVRLTPAQFVIFVGSFLLLSSIAGGLSIRFLKSLPPTSSTRPTFASSSSLN